jgi:flagellar protein FliO/FliZ
MIRPKLLTACAVPVGLALLRAAPALAAGRGEATPLNLEPVPRHAAAAASGGGGLVRTLVGLAIVVGVIYGLYWVLRRVRSGGDVAVGGRGLASLASLPLGPGRAVHLVRAGRELVLVGSSEHGVVALRVYSAAEAREVGLVDDEPSGEPPAGPPPAGTGLRAAVGRLQQWTVRG